MTELRERFDKKGFGVSRYADAHGLCQPILSNVLNQKSRAKGTNRSRLGRTKRVYEQLKEDGVWVGPLPWENKGTQR